MAELSVERKKKSPVLWILLAIVLLAVVAYVVWSNRERLDNDTTPAQTQQTTTTPAVPPGQ